jgi:hypothetical protein
VVAMIQRAMIVVMGCGAMALGCSDGAGPDASGEAPGRADETQEIVENLEQAGFPADDVVVRDGVVYVGRDAVVSLPSSREMLQAGPGAGSKEQYRTNNLVDTGFVSTICVDGSNFWGDPFSWAFDRALDNYNALGLRFWLRRTWGETDGCDAVIGAYLYDGVGGVAGFPGGGYPYGDINIGAGTADYGGDTLAHVITHELGHTLGFRHSDFFNRRISCGQGGNEGDGGVGAIYIDGTPGDAWVGGSLMNSCFRAQESGYFTDTDVTALYVLYGW